MKKVNLLTRYGEASLLKVAYKAGGFEKGECSQHPQSNCSDKNIIPKNGDFTRPYGEEREKGQWLSVLLSCWNEAGYKGSSIDVKGNFRQIIRNLAEAAKQNKN